MKELIEILLKVKSKIPDESDMLWTYFESPVELRKEIDGFILQLEEENVNCLAAINIHFIATGTFQEHSLMNGWSDEYLILAEKFDIIYNQLTS